MSLNNLRANILLAMQTALLGMITKNIRAISCDWNENEIFINFIYNKEPSGEDKSICSEIEAEVISHFPEHKISVKLIAIPETRSLKGEMLPSWVYMRRE